MRPRFALLAALLTILFLGAPAMAASSLEGAWQLQVGEFVDGAGQRVDYGEARLQGIKVLDGGTFAFTTHGLTRARQRGIDFEALDETRSASIPEYTAAPLPEWLA